MTESQRIAGELDRYSEGDEFQRVTEEAVTLLLKQEAALRVALEALKDISYDYAERFDMDDPSTNIGIKFVVQNAQDAIKQIEDGL